MAWLRLRTIHSQIVAANLRLRQLQQEDSALRRANLEKLQAGTSCGELRVDSVIALEFEQRRVTQLLDSLAQQRRIAEKAFMTCRREREIVENAIALERAAYETDRSRRTQAAVDDETLQRKTRDCAENVEPIDMPPDPDNRQKTARL